MPSEVEVVTSNSVERQRDGWSQALQCVSRPLSIHGERGYELDGMRKQGDVRRLLNERSAREQQVPAEPMPMGKGNRDT
jgi:hypothetical protein